MKIGKFVQKLKKITTPKEKKGNSQKSQKDKKLKVLEFIENNGTKSEFLHWIINNNGDIAFSEKDSWETIKGKLCQDKKVTYENLRAYSASLKKKDDIKDGLEEVVETTEKAEETVKKLNFINNFRKFSIAVGGTIFFLGLLRLIAVGSFVFGIWDPNFLQQDLMYTVLALLTVIGLIELFGGIFLITL